MGSLLLDHATRCYRYHSRTPNDERDKQTSEQNKPTEDIKSAASRLVCVDKQQVVVAVAVLLRAACIRLAGLDLRGLADR